MADVTQPKRAARKATTAKAVVTRPFTGLKEGGRVFMPGEAFEGTRTRVAELVKRGFLREA